MAAVSYDSVEILSHFASRAKIGYPLLSDGNSQVIRAFGILNENFPAESPWFGVPFPGYYVIDELGIVQAKYFEEDHRDRYTSASILVREFGEDASDPGEVRTPHLKLRWWSSNPVVRAGQRLTLVLELQLAEGMHAYAPEVEGYIPIRWDIPSADGWLAHPVSYPEATPRYLPAIQETVPVYAGKIRLMRDLSLGMVQELGQEEGGIGLEGAFRYQACDEKVCYPPRTVPLKWTFRLEGLDRVRSPEGMRHPDP